MPRRTRMQRGDRQHVTDQWWQPLASLLAVLVLAGMTAGCSLWPLSPTPTVVAPSVSPSATVAIPATPTAAAPSPALPTATVRATETATRPPSATPSPRPATATPSATAVAPTVPATPSPTATAQPTPACFAAASALDLRNGPGIGYRLILRLQVAEELTPLARDLEGGWLQVVTLDGIQGWIPFDISWCQHLDPNALPVIRVVPPTATPQPPTATPRPATPTPTIVMITPTATPIVITDWRGEYFANRFLSGDPVLLRNDVSINFDWGTGRADPVLPADDFSVRWTRWLPFAPGSYRFFVRVDDGARLFVDNVLVLDMWTLGSPRTGSVDVAIAEGYRFIRLEYFEATGNASISLWWEPTVAQAWQGEYFSNPDLRGAPVVMRNDPTINFDWGAGSPAAGLPADGFSVRWTRDVRLEGGVYRFQVVVDDGVRLWVNNSLLIDRWGPAAGATYTADIGLDTGTHSLRLEYYEGTGNARISLSWERLATGALIWRGEYFNNTALQGSPVLVRDEAVIDFIWGLGSPDPKVNADYFSARWIGRPQIRAGNYRLLADSDDGVRVWVNGALVIDGWRLGGGSFRAPLYIPFDGAQEVRVEYFEVSGMALVHVWWVPETGPVPQ